MKLDNVFFWTIVFLDTGSFGFSDIGGLILYQSTSDTNILQHSKLVNCSFALNFVYGKYLEYGKALIVFRENPFLCSRNYTIDQVISRLQQNGKMYKHFEEHKTNQSLL